MKELGVRFLKAWDHVLAFPYNKDMLNRQIKIFTVDLKENNPEIMLNPPAQYLRKFNFHVLAQVFEYYSVPVNTQYLQILCILEYSNRSCIMYVHRTTYMGFYLYMGRNS